MMRNSAWLVVAWGGAALLMLVLPFLMDSWTGFWIATALAVVLVWLGFRKK